MRPTADKFLPHPPANCRAERHMPKGWHSVYSAMLAAAKKGQNDRIAQGKDPGPLVCWATAGHIADMRGIGRRTVTRAIAGMVKAGWLEPRGNQGNQQRRFYRGRWASNMYRVAEHLEFVTKRRQEILATLPDDVPRDIAIHVCPLEGEKIRAGLCLYPGRTTLLKRGEYCKAHRPTVGQNGAPSVH